VPEHLTDERTEVGQVGAALNALLAHVESSLEARHRSEQQVRQFVADASHELRTPLAIIAGYTELARRRPDDDLALRTALVKVEEESGRMTALVEDLLLLARLDSGRPLDRQQVDLTRLLLEAVSDARVLAPDHRWRLALPEEGVEVPGDEQRLHQVVTNLLTNARKYTPPGTTVTVRAHAGGFDVHDDGPGFPPELAGHAFERFVRGDVARTRGGDPGTAGTAGGVGINGINGIGGAGLGLALVHAIVTAHGGAVTLATSPGDTTVAVSLPG
jgi:two-component system OmpR family sensor kinase